ncbi:WD40-repeat-containing domain protein [Ochromonadaceae sp. CCMP2298]|nr:WD40-repeat-containing domain protein [Ochromonadaceae sp. CCMP2298]
MRDYYDEDAPPRARGGGGDRGGGVRARQASRGSEGENRGREAVARRVGGGVQAALNYTPSENSETHEAYPDYPADAQDTRSESAPSTGYSDSRGSRDANAPTNPRELEARSKVFLCSLKAHLLKQASALRMQGKLQRSTALLQASEMGESVARELLSKAFQPYTGAGEGKTREKTCGVEIPDFARVLRSFRFPGAPPLRTETIQFLFGLCAEEMQGGQGGQGGRGGQMQGSLNEAGRPVADPNVLTDLLFGFPTTNRDRRARGLTRVGEAVANDNDAQGRELKGMVARMQSGRDEVGRGPVKLASATDAQAQKALDQISMPLRFVSSKSRSALVVPSHIDPVAAVARSNSLPPYELVRRHVFGMSATVYSGSTLYALPSTPASFRNPHGGGLSRSNPDFIDPAAVVYAAAGLGIVHDLSQNKQHFFGGHDDDVTCITVSADGAYAATGQMGKSPLVHIWTTEVDARTSKIPVNSLGGGFFSRGVCALSFSWDNKYLVAVSCDDAHALGVFDTSSCELVAQQPCQHGIPPQVRWLQYCPAQTHTSHITREHAGPCDQFASAGPHHLKLWSFKRPTASEPGSLFYKAPTLGKATATKAYLCCGFSHCEDRTYDLLAGGSNGMVYMWRAAKLVAFEQILKGAVKCMVVVGDKVYCGGAGGVLKTLSCRTLGTLQQFSLISDAPPTPLRMASAGVGNIGAPTSRSAAALAAAAPSRLAHRATIKPRAPLAAPKSHAAGAAGGSLETAGDAVSGGGMGPQEEVEDETGARLVTGLAVVGQGRSAYVLCALGTGRLVRVDVGQGGNAPGTPRSRPGSARPGTAPRPGTAGGDGKELFSYHTGPVYGLAADTSQSNRLLVTCGDDRKLNVWDAQDCVLLARTATKMASRCVHVDASNCFIAVGSASGTLTIYYLSDQLLPSSKYYKISEVGFRKDARAEATDVKFSPSNDLIALGCRDDCIYLYGCQLETVQQGHGRGMHEAGVCQLKALHRLRGHSSSITHLDWAHDSLLLRSTCAAYELLCWDVRAGKLSQVNASDVKWQTQHCTLGFNVMGIWPPYTDGTDINALDVSRLGLVATANDQGGLVRLHNHPCVVRNAPGKEYGGHSSHVMNLKFMRGGEVLATVGGNDRSVVVWEVVKDESAMDAFR